MKRCADMPRWFVVLIVVFALLKLWLVSDLSIVAIGKAGHDDRLFLTLAKYLVNGEWLGAYNVLTLAKGPFYPIWIALVFLAGFPLLFAQQVLYVFAVVFFVLTVRPLFERLFPLAVLYIVVLFNPMTYATDGLRVVREGIYPALSVLLLTGMIAIMLRVNETRIRLYSVSVVTGFLLSFFWLTREEGIWIVPSLLIIMAWTLRKSCARHNCLRPLIACGLPWLVLVLSLGLVAVLNFHHYGVFATVEFKASPFLNAYGALCRIKAARWIPDVPVPQETRLRLYRLSSSFAELEPFLEGDIGRKWVQKKYHGEIPGGWFMWALRDAVDAAGYGKSGARAMSFYRKMARQINDACDGGKIDCFAARSSMMSPWHADYIKPLLKTFVRGVSYLLKYDGFSAEPGRSRGPDSLLVIFRDLTRSPVAPSHSDNYVAGGWVFSEKPSAVVQFIQERQEDSVVAELDRTASPDVESFFARKGERFSETGKARFEIEDFDASRSWIVVRNRGEILARIPLDGSVNEWSDNGVHFYLDFLKKTGILPEQDRIAGKKRSVLDILGKSYQWGIRWLFIAGAGVYLFSLFQSCRRKRFPDGLIIATALFCAVVIRIFILSLVSVTSFPALTILYLSPAYPLLLLYSVFALSYKPLAGAVPGPE